MIKADETPFPSLARGRYGRGHPACAFRPRASGHLCPDRRFCVFAKLLQLPEGPGESHTKVNSLSTLQSAPGSRIDPGRTCRGRDAEHVSMRGNREALSRTDYGHRQGPQHPVVGEGAGNQSWQAKLWQAGQEIEVK